MEAPTSQKSVKSERTAPHSWRRNLCTARSVLNADRHDIRIEHRNLAQGSSTRTQSRSRTTGGLFWLRGSPNRTRKWKRCPRLKHRLGQSASAALPLAGLHRNWSGNSVGVTVWYDFQATETIRHDSGPSWNEACLNALHSTFRLEGRDTIMLQRLVGREAPLTQVKEQSP